MKRILAAVSGGLVMAFLWLWNGANAVIRLIDWYSRADTVHTLSTSNDIWIKSVGWLLGTPWPVPAGLATLLTLYVGYLLFAHAGNASPRNWEALSHGQKRAEQPSSNDAQDIEASQAPTEEEITGPPPFNPSGLYVGQILVADQQLSTDFYMEIAIRAFNGSGRPVSLGPIRGTPTLSIVTNGKSEPPIPLPSPRLTTDRTPTDNIGNNEEFLILLEQRMPRDLAERVSSISGPVQAQIRLVDVSIMVSPTESPLERVRLPLWSGISLNHDPQRMIVGRVVEASARIVIGGVKSDSQ